MPRKAITLPKETIIALPHGGPPWDSACGTRFIHSPKGMITQRAESIKSARCRYLLLFDDDIEFKDVHVIEKLFMEMLSYGAQVALPYSLEALPQGKIKQIYYALFGIAMPTKKRHLSYTPSGGFYYPWKPSFQKPDETEGGRGCCIATNRELLMNDSILGDLDLERIPYALRDDGAFVPNVVLHGGKAILVRSIPYDHLGGKRASTPERLCRTWRATIYNNWVFSRKYILRRYKFLGMPIVAFGWHLLGLCPLAILSFSHRKNIQPLLGITYGLKMMVKELVKEKI